MSSLETAFEIDPTIVEVPFYFYQKSAHFLTYKNCIISNILKKGQAWEPHLHKIFKYFITKNHTVIEAGCHIGSHSIFLSKLSKQLICFEPLSYSADILEHNLQLNECNNTIVYRKALSSNNSNVIFSHVVEGNPGQCVLQQDHKSTSQSQVSSTTIDELDLEQLHFIKLDTEGFESKIIQGGWETIKKFRPIITLECYENDWGQYSLSHTQATFSNLIDFGYEVTQIYGCDFLFLPTKQRTTI